MDEQNNHNSDFLVHLTHRLGLQEPQENATLHLRPDGKTELRVITAKFVGLEGREREALLWEALREMPTAQMLTMTYSLLLTPDEAQRYFSENLRLVTALAEDWTQD